MTLNQSFRCAALKLAAAPMPLADLPHLSRFANPGKRESLWTNIGSKLPRASPAATVAGSTAGSLVGPAASATSSGIRALSLVLPLPASAPSQATSWGMFPPRGSS